MVEGGAFDVDPSRAAFAGCRCDVWYAAYFD